MEDFKANWEELKLRYKEEGSKRERIVKVFYDYYFPILEKKGTVLIKKYKAPEIDGISITNDILIDFIKKFEIKITKNNFQSADDLERYLIKILHNRIKRLLKRKRFIEVEFDDEVLVDSELEYNFYKTEFDFYAKATEVAKIFTEIYSKVNERCFELLALFIIKSKTYEEILKLDNYREVSYANIRKQKERCLEKLTTFLNINKYI